MASEVASTMKASKPGFEESAESKAFPIRMTLTSTKVKAVEQGIYFVLDLRVPSPPRPSNATLPKHYRRVSLPRCH